MVDQSIEKRAADDAQEDDFTLNAAQMMFMINVDAAAERADAEEDHQFFDDLTASDEWKRLFGDMSWDQAYDRCQLPRLKARACGRSSRLTNG